MLLVNWLLAKKVEYVGLRPLLLGQKKIITDAITSKESQKGLYHVTFII